MYSDQILTQVFQLALCNLNCWYCFVPNILKAANDNYSKWFSCDELVELILKNNQSPHVIDLSGGNPELVPEWLIEMMKSLEKHSLTKDYYLWSDDALSTDLFFEVLSPSEIDYVKNYKNYGKVCCFKGFDKYSCNFNTGKSLDFFDEQINRFSKYHNLNIDLYGYVTLTDETYEDIDNRISSFFDALQKIHPYLPLRTIPLKIKMFSPLQGAIYNKYATSISNQSFAIEAWKNQLNKRFTSAELSCNITEINLN